MREVRVLTVNEAARRLRRSRYLIHRMLLKGSVTPAWVNDNPGVLEDEGFLALERENADPAGVAA